MHTSTRWNPATVGNVATALLLIALVTAALTRTTPAPAPELGHPTVEGATLPPVTTGDDPSIGTAAPAFTATATSTGRKVRAPAAGAPTRIVFIDRTCTNCPPVDPGEGSTRVVLVTTRLTGGGAHTTGSPASTAAWATVDDPDGILADAYGAASLPFTVVIDSDGNVTRRQ